jgi:hypothetical protein
VKCVRRSKPDLTSMYVCMYLQEGKKEAFNGGETFESNLCIRAARVLSSVSIYLWIDGWVDGWIRIQRKFSLSGEGRRRGRNAMLGRVYMDG